MSAGLRTAPAARARSACGGRGGRPGRPVAREVDERRAAGVPRAAATPSLGADRAIAWSGDSLRARRRRARRRRGRGRRRRAVRRPCPPRWSSSARAVKEHGDYATNVALQLAKPAGRPPREVAELLAARLREVDGVDAVDVAGPGFLNLRLGAGRARRRSRARSWRRARRTARNAAAAGQHVNLEFVSANPTGPIHIGGVRWAAVGDALGPAARGQRRQGHPRVLLQRPRRPDRPLRRARCWRRGQGEPAPEDGYGGAYVADIAARGRSREVPDVLEQPDAAGGLPPRAASSAMFGEIKPSLHELRRRLRRLLPRELAARVRAPSTRAVERLRAQGHVYEADGAVWLRTTDFGDDKDRVVVKSDGEPTYISGRRSPTTSTSASAASTAASIMLGADHHGYVGRLMAMCAAFGDDPGVRPRDPHRPAGQPGARRRAAAHEQARRAPSSRLEDLVDAIGVDAARYAARALQRRRDARPRPRPGHAAEQRQPRLLRAVRRDPRRLGAAQRGRDGHRRARPRLGRPVAAARTRARASCCSRWRSSPRSSRPRPSCASRTASRATSRRRSPSPRSASGTTARCCPRATRRSPPTTAPRLLLWRATRTVLENGLRLLGVSAPERM